MFKVSFGFAVISSVLIGMAAPAAAQFGGKGDLVQAQGENGQINWTTYKMRVKGQAAPNMKHADNPAKARIGAERAAKIDAMRNALETLKGVSITSTSTVEDFMLTSDVIKSEVNGVIQGAVVVDTTYQSDTGVTVFIEVPVMGEMARILMPQDLGSKVPPAPPAGAPAPTPSIDGTAYTGLIIDARNLGVKPERQPQILDENGAVIYSAASVSREYALEIGVVGYGKDVDSAKTNDRVTNVPLVVTAKGKAGQKAADVVISNADAAKLQEITKSLSFLNKCRVMIIL